MDVPMTVITGFTEEFIRLSRENPEVAKHDLSEVSDDEAYELGRRGARSALAPLIWRAKVGERWDVMRTTEFLGISRQALYKRVRSGTALGVPGEGTTWFPTWQFDVDHQVIRQVTDRIISAFRRADPEISPLVIAAWVTAPNRRLKNDLPSEWISQAKDPEAVIMAAERAAAGLAA